MRILTGLTPATSGSATILGQPFAALTNPGRHVGVLLDASAQHSGRTGREILALSALTQALGKARVDRMLDVVGLSKKESGRRVKDYSLGMRQRLGIAAALIGDPEVLMLDEPANGLDPAGIRWMRDLLGRFADEGGTVLLSSHLLNEIERIADDIIVIGRGAIVAHGTTEELLRPSGAFVKSTDDTALAHALRDQQIDTDQVEGGLRTAAEPSQIGAVAAALQIPLIELRPADNRGLEEMFLTLTSDDARVEAAA